MKTTIIITIAASNKTIIFVISSSFGAWKCNNLLNISETPDLSIVEVVDS